MELSVITGRGALASHNRLWQNECAIAFARAASHAMRGHEQKESAEQGLALFYIPTHQQTFGNYCSPSWEPWQ